MAVIDLLLFGTIGITIWAIQMMWIPFWAAGVVNGLGHAVGYRNFECRDAATNLVPWGIIIGGEELHNNHHTYPNSAKLSVRRWEFDMGWMWIRLLSMLRLAKVQRVAPIAHRVEGKASLDMDTAMAILNNRFQIMAQYRKLVIGPLVKQELDKVDTSVRRRFRRAKRLLSRETSLLQDRHHVRIESLLAHSQALKTIYEKRLALQQIWARTSANGHDMLAACNRLKSGISPAWRAGPWPHAHRREPFRAHGQRSPTHLYRHPAPRSCSNPARPVARSRRSGPSKRARAAVQLAARQCQRRPLGLRLGNPPGALRQPRLRTHLRSPGQPGAGRLQRMARRHLPG